MDLESARGLIGTEQEFVDEARRRAFAEALVVREGNVALEQHRLLDARFCILVELPQEEIAGEQAERTGRCREHEREIPEVGTAPHFS